MTTPATRIVSLTGRLCAENDRGSLALSPSSPSSLTKPPIGSQFSVYRVSPFERSTRARGGKPIPNSSTRTPASAGHDEVAELVDDHEPTEDGEEQDDRDDRLEELGHAAPPTGPAANAARTSASSATSVSTSGSSVAPPPNRSSALSSSRGMPGKSSEPSRKRATATSSAAIRAADARGPARPASRAMRSAGKRSTSGTRKSRRPVATRSGGAGR